MTTLDDVKFLLESVRECIAQAEDLWNAYLTAEEQATKTTTSLTGMPRGGGADRSQQLSALVDAKDKWEEASGISVSCIKKVRDLIRNSTLNGVEQHLLESRYIFLYSWREIRNTCYDDSGVSLISERTMYRWHSDALEHLREYIIESNIDMSNFDICYIR